MFDAIGTLFIYIMAAPFAILAACIAWTALVGLIALLWMILRAIAMILWTPFALIGMAIDQITAKISGKPAPRPGPPPALTYEQRRQWANREGPYADA